MSNLIDAKNRYFVSEILVMLRGVSYHTLNRHIKKNEKLKHLIKPGCRKIYYTQEEVELILAEF